MSIWGKVIGGTVGFFALGGPLGALMGLAAGHLVDQTMKSRRPAVTHEHAAEAVDHATDLQLAFTIAVIALVAKLAKADGRVTSDEVQALKRVFPIPESATPHVARIFDEAKASPDGYEAYARQIAMLLGRREAVLEDLLGALLMVAHVDGVYHPAERAMVADIGRIFGFSLSDIRRLEGMFMETGARSDPYEVLGLAPQASDAEVKAAYRKLLRQNHPDRVTAQGLPEEFIEVANRKMAEINAAHDRIKAERGLN